MNGMSTTGKPISGLEHLRQSIADIITTPMDISRWDGIRWISRICETQ